MWFAVGIGFGLPLLAGHITLYALLVNKSWTTVRLMNYLIGYCAVATSSCVNVVLMRENELKSGITVRDEQTGNDLGLSKVAAH